MYKKILKNESVKQSLFLLISTIGGMIFLLASNALISRNLSKREFGDYSLILNVFTFSQTIFNFGFFYSISRLIALTKDNTKIKRLYGLGLGFILLLSIGMAIFIFMFSEYEKIKGNFNVSYSLIVCLPFAFIFLLNNFNELLLQGGNRIKLLSFSRFTPRLFFFLLLLVLLFFFDFDTKAFLLLFIVCQMLPYVVVIRKLKPSFNNLRSVWPEVIKANKEFGFNIYLGSIVAVGASNLSGLLISFFGESNQDVGFYAIALQFSAPLALIPNVLATVSFKKFANSKFIEPKLIWITLAISIFSALGIIILGKYIIRFVYGDQYLEAVNFLNLSAIASVLYGVSDFFNRFLLSNGKGKELRNTSIYVGSVLLLSNVFFIKNFGGIGASISSILAGIVYLILIFGYYKKFQRHSLA